MTGIRFEPVIGLEVHIQLQTGRKLFCADSTTFGATPNTLVCPVCLGLPGALPVLDPAAVGLALRAALGLGCRIHRRSVFARKNYFYPDLPKGYQISQFEHPLASGGIVPVEGGRQVRIRRVHMEEDAGKSLHDRFTAATAVDLNRSGTPLIEIVSEPDLRSPAEARAYLRYIRQLMEYLEVSDCNMEEGSLRVDANVSLRKAGSSGLETPTEIKNLNTFSGVEKALRVEIERQTRIRSAGGSVQRETLLWDAARGDVRTMRSKEDSRDYRYFPDPDLPPLRITDERIEEARAALPELAEAKRRRFEGEYGLPDYAAGVLTASRGRADYFEAVVACGAEPKAASNWVMGPVLRVIKEEGIHLGRTELAPDRLAELIALERNRTIASVTAKAVLATMARTGERAPVIVEREGLAQVREDSHTEEWIRRVVRAHPQVAARYRAGETRLLGFLIGQVMRTSERRADPRRVRRLLIAVLRDGEG